MSDPIADIQSRALEGEVIDALRTVFDPEIPVNIYDLGLIYDVDVQEGNKVHVKMTLTSPACPVAGSLPGEVEQTVRSVEGVADATVELVWEPPWDISMIPEPIRMDLGLW